MINIAIVGEAWGAEEEIQRTPFVGPSGYLLTKMLEEAGIRRADCFLTNVFNFRPKGNDIDTLCESKSENRTGLPPIKAGKYIRSEFLPELDRLREELRGCSPNIVIALGNTACWALLATAGISKIRGTISGSDFTGRPQKVLPTYHPAAILRDWSLRHVTVLDLLKAERESHFPEIRRPERTIYIEPSLTDLEWFHDRFIEGCQFISFDVETSGDQITCIGFAPNTACALVVPFYDIRGSDGSYWPTHESECAAWNFVRRVLGRPEPKVAQNGLYDITFLWRQYGIPVVNPLHDTMLLHHALQPESPKGLGFLGSVYTNEASWKLMRARGKETIKKED